MIIEQKLNEENKTREKKKLKTEKKCMKFCEEQLSIFCKDFQKVSWLH